MQITNLVATLRDLENQKEGIDRAIASLKALGNGNLAPRPHQTVVGGVLAHLKKVGAPQTNSQLREALQEMGVVATPPSIQTIISKRGRMKKDLMKMGRGVWGLKGWRKPSE